MRHILRGVGFAALVSMLASLLWAALPFTDAFTATDGTALATYNAVWSVTTGTAAIQGNAAGCATSAGCLAKETGETYSNDQTGTGTIKTPLANYYMGIGLRIGTGDTGYRCVVDDNEFRIDRRNTGNTTLTTESPAPTVNDGEKIEFFIVGSSLTCYRKNSGGTIIATLGPITDTTFSTGRPGIAGFNSATTSTTRIDDVTLNDYSAGSSAPIARRLITMFFTLPEFAQ